MNYISRVLKNFRRYHSFFRATIYVSRVSHTINDFAIVRPCENGFKSPRFNQFNCFQMILIAWVGELVQIRISSFAMGFPWNMANSCKYEKKNKQLWRFLIRNTFKKIRLGPIYLQFLLKFPLFILSRSVYSFLKKSQFSKKNSPFYFIESGNLSGN